MFAEWEHFCHRKKCKKLNKCSKSVSTTYTRYYGVNNKNGEEWRDCSRILKVASGVTLILCAIIYDEANLEVLLNLIKYLRHANYIKMLKGVVEA